MDNPNIIPVVNVGIITAAEICLEITGAYRDKSENRSFTGKLTARAENGRIVISDDKNRYVYENEVLLAPENPETGNFRIFNVTIGIGFHWQKKEDHVFRGGLNFKENASGITVINSIPVEDYLISVISSEMSATSSPGLLKAHAVISRSWLLAQIEKGRNVKIHKDPYRSSWVSDKEIVRWYDREDHTDFDVCADDHCQRYQGITRASTAAVEEAVTQTSGEVLVFEDQLCDARFSKCCGGITEKFEHVWEPVSHPYLQRVYDNEESKAHSVRDLSVEGNAREWILASPPAFCNTLDKKVRSQVLNDYDQATHDFFRWTITMDSDSLSELVKSKTGIDFGMLHDLIPVERGVSGRLIKLKIMGSKKTMVIGKELEIRKALSPSHLYSSAFVVDKKERNGKFEFILRGAGWGHGVGLCQIGAAVMGAKGYNYKDILLHYFRGAEVRKRY
jgi:SpoIID/LytB domain protein